MKRPAWALALMFPLAVLSEENLIGSGLRARPAYDGSNAQRGELVPVVRYSRGPWFARTTQGILEGGARMELGTRLLAGAQLAYEGGRKQSESAFLANRNTPDLDPGASAGLHIEWDGKLGPAPVTLLGRVRQDLDSDRGAQADVRITAGVYRSSRVLAGLFGQVTWASGKSVRSFYETGDGGLVSTSAGLLGALDLNRRWLVVGSVEGRRLHGDAARSPLAERKSNYYASAGIAYRF
jgi:outer membrane scaffolding protein for murein synthesis (MipA/OmpV family)